MTNQPMPQGSKFHDASDLRCVRHRDAVQRKGIKPMADRTCPVCNPQTPAATGRFLKIVASQEITTQ